MKINFKIKLVITCIFISIKLDLFAVQVNSCEISYQKTSNKYVYWVKVKVYKDCSGGALCLGCENPIPNGNTLNCTLKNSGFSTAIVGNDLAYDGVSFGDFDLPISEQPENGKNYTENALCGQLKTNCTNCNTRTAGTVSGGIEVYYFEGLVSLKNIPEACCNVVLSVSIDKRNLSSTNLVSETFYNECIINRCIENSSPVFNGSSVVYFCQGGSFSSSLNLIDPDGDSLSYKMTSSKKARRLSVAYKYPYSEEFPLLYLDDRMIGGFGLLFYDGNLSFRSLDTPMNANILIEVTQWKPVNGEMTEVGVTNYDMQLISTKCGLNLPPLIKILDKDKFSSISNFYVQAGREICLKLIGEDRYSGKEPIIKSDTIDMYIGKFNQVFNSKNFSKPYDTSKRNELGPKNDTILFCWTPRTEDIRPLPYSFSLKACDRQCPLKSCATIGVNIYVLQYPLSIINENDIDFNIYPNPTNETITLTLDRVSNNDVEFQITDLYGNEILQKNFAIQTEEIKQDVSFISSGVYFIKLLIGRQNVKSKKFIKE